jgi:phage shock protein PspC (stress-responsive transcriptional regulator)
VVMKRVYLSKTENKIAGVCGGFAESLNIDPTFIRLLFVAVFLSPLVSTAVLFYLLCWIVIPRDPGYSK